MSDSRDGGGIARQIKRAISLEAVILLATLIAGLGGQWALMSSRISDQQKTIDGLNTQISMLRSFDNELSARNYKLDGRVGTLEARNADLWDAIRELRQRSQ